MTDRERIEQLEQEVKELHDIIETQQMRWDAQAWVLQNAPQKSDAAKVELGPAGRTVPPPRLCTGCGKERGTVAYSAADMGGVYWHPACLRKARKAASDKGGADRG